ncbi:MAG TPA: pirin family protein [Candidatus Polarisedimenticolia bacterium]|jgi:hypothetical protein
MITIRPAGERGRTSLGWLDSRHTFSFGEYFDREQMGFSVLRVINEDWIKPGKGFGTHPHRDMEIITHVMEGALQHKDSMGTGSIIRPGDAQRMSAGTGVTHSEFNASRTDGVHLLQIWILPDRGGRTPGYQQRSFPSESKRGRLCLVASRDARKGSLSINQDVDLFISLLAPGQSVTRELRPGRSAWVQVTSGSLSVQGEGEAAHLKAGDGAAVSKEERVTIRGEESAEVLLFDLP